MFREGERERRAAAAELNCYGWWMCVGRAKINFVPKPRVSVRLYYDTY